MNISMDIICPTVMDGKQYGQVMAWLHLISEH